MAGGKIQTVKPSLIRPLALGVWTVLLRPPYYNAMVLFALDLFVHILCTACEATKTS